MKALWDTDVPDMTAHSVSERVSEWVNERTVELALLGSLLFYSWEGTDEHWPEQFGHFSRNTGRQFHRGRSRNCIPFLRIVKKKNNMNNPNVEPFPIEEGTLNTSTTRWWRRTYEDTDVLSFHLTKPSIYRDCFSNFRSVCVRVCVWVGGVLLAECWVTLSISTIRVLEVCWEFDILEVDR